MFYARTGATSVLTSRLLEVEFDKVTFSPIKSLTSVI
jgi:hypothetical protein